MVVRDADSHLGPGRPREFDPEEAVDNAMAVFWDKGYAGASLPDLLEGMNLTRGSFYKAFGDKRSLFLKALDNYTQVGIKETSDILSSSCSTKDAIRQSLLRISFLSKGEAGRRGCLIVAAAIEMASQDQEVAYRIRQTFDRLQALYAATILRGQASGEINARKDSLALARFLVCQIEGMRVLGKVDRAMSEANEIVDLAMSLLD